MSRVNLRLVHHVHIRPKCVLRAVKVYSRAVERDVTVGGFLLDVGCDDGWVWDARGVQTVVRGHHVWGEPRGQKTV